MMRIIRNAKKYSNLNQAIYKIRIQNRHDRTQIHSNKEKTPTMYRPQKQHKKLLKYDASKVLYFAICNRK